MHQLIEIPKCVECGQDATKVNKAVTHPGVGGRCQEYRAIHVYFCRGHFATHREIVIKNQFVRRILCPKAEKTDCASCVIRGDDLKNGCNIFSESGRISN